jgi:hypothetical protein
MRHNLRKLALVLACAMLAIGGCANHDAVQRESLIAIASPPIPTDTQEVTNPLRGQYEDLLQTLFPQGNTADRQYPAWPKTHDASLRLSWRQLQPTDPRTLGPDAPDDQKYDFQVIDEALADAAKRGARLMLQVYSYNSCCNAQYPDNTNIEIPDWIRAFPAASTSYPGPPTGSAAPRITQVVPNWNDPHYLDGFEQLLEALGHRYDNDERLSVFEFSGYGDFSENHISYVRDTLKAPGPSQEDSMKELGYYAVFHDQTITLDSIRRLVAAHARAFPHTQMDVTSNNPEIMRELFVDPNITQRLDSPVGIRTNALGMYSPMPVWATNPYSQYVVKKNQFIDEVRKRFATAPVITEWADLTDGRARDLPSYYQQALRDIVKYHVAMTSSVNFPDSRSNSAMDSGLYLQWAQANVIAGYRYSVAARGGSESVRDRVAAISATWTNYGSAAAIEKWSPGYRLADFSGAVLRTIPSHVVLKDLVHTEPVGGSDSQQPVPASTTESVRVELAGLPPGHYTLQAAAEWKQHKPGATHAVNYPPMQLARDGRDGSGWYPVASLDIPRSDLKAGSPQ